MSEGSPETLAPAAVTGRFRAFRALRNRGYRAYFFAQLVSFAGTWMQSVALGWLVFRLTGSAFLLGLVAFAGQFPSLLLSPFAGVIADRVALRKMVGVTQALLALQAVALAVMAWTGHESVPVLLALAAAQGLVNAFDLPARQTILMELAGPEDLSSAIALTSSAVNAARMFGTAIGGILVGSVGEATCFAVNAATFLATIGVVLVVKPTHERDLGAGAAPPVLGALREGLAYAKRAPHVRAILPLVAITSLVSIPYLTMLPVFAGRVLRGGPELLGWLNAVAGFGAIVGALAVAALPERRQLLPRIAFGLFVFGAGLVALGLSETTWITLLALPLAGGGMLTELACANTVIQGDTPPEVRGRVMSLYSTVLVGLFPVGALLCGGVAERIGVGDTVAIGGVLTIVCGVWFTRRLPGLRAARVGEGAR